MSQEVIEITEREIEVIEIVESGPVGPVGPQADINYTVVSSSQSVTNRQMIAADTSGGVFALTLPADPSNGDAIDIFDYSETFDTNNLTINRNGSRIESIEEDLICNVEGAYFTLIYTGATRGWQVVPRFGTSGGGGESVLTTQGDTLYRAVGVNARLPIGSAGQILKVNSGATAPEWGEAPATGVTSVSATAPIVSSGGATPTISISPATTSAAGSMSSADKTKLNNAVETSRTISAGTGLTGGGDLSANRTLSVSFGSSAGMVAEGNDSRFIDDYTVITSGQTVNNGARIAADTASSSFTLTLPATPSNGDTVYIFDRSGTFDTNPLTIGRNGSNIEGLAEDLNCDIEDAAFSLVYVDATTGWKVMPYSGTAIAGVISNPAGVAGADAITNMMSLTQAEYNAIGSPDPTTLFLITDP